MLITIETIVRAVTDSVKWTKRLRQAMKKSSLMVLGRLLVTSGVVPKIKRY